MSGLEAQKTAVIVGVQFASGAQGLSHSLPVELANHFIDMSRHRVLLANILHCYNSLINLNRF